MAKIRLYTTALAVLSSTDAVLQQYAAGNYVLDCSGQAISVSGNGVKARFPNLSEVTNIIDADGNPVTLPVTQAEYVTLISGYFRGLAAAGGGGGGGDVNVLNFPDNFPDNESRDELIAANATLTGIAANTEGTDDKMLALLSEVGTAGTAETSSIPDGPAAGSGIRKMLYGIWDAVRYIFPSLTGISGSIDSVVDTLNSSGTGENSLLPDSTYSGGGIRKFAFEIWRKLNNGISVTNTVTVTTNTNVSTQISTSTDPAYTVRAINDSLEVVETLSHGAVNNSIFNTINARGFQGAYLTCLSAGGSPTLRLEFSDDGVTWTPSGRAIQIPNNGAPTDFVNATDVIASANQVFIFDIYRKYVRLRVNSSSTNSSVWLLRLVQTPTLTFSGDNAVSKPVTQSGTWSVTQSGTWTVAPSAPAVASGTLPATGTKIVSALGINATSAATGNRTIQMLVLGNYGAGTTAYFKLYNKASAPTPGAGDIPVFVFPIASGQTITIPIPENGIRTGTAGLAWVIVGGAADNDTTAVAANQVTGTIIYV